VLPVLLELLVLQEYKEKMVLRDLQELLAL
jgi:hypothetical protein